MLKKDRGDDRRGSMGEEDKNVDDSRGEREDDSNNERRDGGDNRQGGDRRGSEEFDKFYDDNKDPRVGISGKVVFG